MMINFKEIAENTQRLNNLLFTVEEVWRAIKLIMGCTPSTKEAADNFYRNLCQSTTDYEAIKKIINDPKGAEKERKKYTEEE